MKPLNPPSDLNSALNKCVSDLPDPADFTLSSELVAYLLDHYNIKICNVKEGFMCYAGHDVGNAQMGSSSGICFRSFLKSRGFKKVSDDLAHDLNEFCHSL